MELINTEAKTGVKNSKALIKESRKTCSRTVAKADVIRKQKQSSRGKETHMTQRKLLKSSEQLLYS